MRGRTIYNAPYVSVITPGRIMLLNYDNYCFILQCIMFNLEWNIYFHFIIYWNKSLCSVKHIFFNSGNLFHFAGRLVLLKVLFLSNENSSYIINVKESFLKKSNIQNRKQQATFWYTMSCMNQRPCRSCYTCYPNTSSCTISDIYEESL